MDPQPPDSANSCVSDSLQTTPIIDASSELRSRRIADDYECPFVVVEYQVTAGQHLYGKKTSFAEAVLKITMGASTVIEGAEGVGPVDALYAAMAKALYPSYPAIRKLQLVDYSVRIAERHGGTGVAILVEIVLTDGSKTWKTAGQSTNIIVASWDALFDAIEFGLFDQPASRFGSSAKAV